MSDTSAKDIIKKGFLEPDDAAFVDANISEIEANWSKGQVLRTETEMRVSVLDDIRHPTHASKYWQCVREQAVQYENLVQLSFDYRRNAVEQRKLTKAIAETDDELERELLEIDLEEKQFTQNGMEKVARHRMREIRLWLVIMAECVEADPNFDTADVNIHQMISYALSWEAKLKNLGNASPSETANLVGQYDTVVRHLKALGIAHPGKALKSSTQSLSAVK